MINVRLLIVDDDPGVRAGVAAALKDDPFFVSRACTGGRAALAGAIEWRPDLILLDEQMPGMNGTTVLKRLRADRRTAPISVVFMAKAPIQPRRCARLIACGAAGVINKPCIDKRCDPATLGATLRRFVAVEGVLSPAREKFFRRLEADAGALSDCRRDLAQTRPEPVLMRINQIAAFARRRRRHLWLCRHLLRLRRAVGRRGKHPRRPRQTERSRARPRPAPGAHRAALARDFAASSAIHIHAKKCQTPGHPAGFIRPVEFARLSAKQGGACASGRRSCSTLPSERAPRRSTPRGSTG